MSLNRFIATAFATLLVAGFWVPAAQAGMSCPPTHDGKPLYYVGLYQGDPANLVQSMPENGRFVVPQAPKSEWATTENYTLGCTYTGTKETVTVVLPHNIRVCTFVNYPHVDCHP